MIDINEVMKDPKQRAAFAYYEASANLKTLLETSDQPWQDVFRIIRRLAKQQNAVVISAYLDDSRTPAEDQDALAALHD